jgi:hypothetical protein
MTKKSKEQRLKELLKQEPQRRPAEGPHTQTSKVETKDLGEAVGYRKCTRIKCDEFGNLHAILVRGEETLVRPVGADGQVLDKVENSTIRHFPRNSARSRSAQWTALYS